MQSRSSQTKANVPFFGTSLIGPLNCALHDSGKEILDKEKRGLVWEDANLAFGRVRLDPEDFEVDEIGGDSECTFGAVKFHGRPKELAFYIVPEPKKGFGVVIGKGNRAYRYDPGRSLRLTINVNWRENRGVMVPRTRKKNEDNLDVIFIDETGRFIQIQILLCCRGEKVWVACQEIYEGHLVRTTVAKAKEAGMEYRDLSGGKAGFVVPMSSVHSGPHGEYLAQFYPAKKFFEIAVEEGAYDSRQLCQVNPAKWDPDFPDPSLAPGEDWEVGIVSFFNAILGLGKLITIDAEGNQQMIHVYFSAIEDSDGTRVVEKGLFPILKRMQPVAFKAKERVGKEPEATVVRLLNL